jgi:hypothetical protein
VTLEKVLEKALWSWYLEAQEGLGLVEAVL